MAGEPLEWEREWIEEQRKRAHKPRRWANRNARHGSREGDLLDDGPLPPELEAELDAFLKQQSTVTESGACPDVKE